MKLVYAIKGHRGFKFSHVIEVEKKEWQNAGTSPFPGSVSGTVVFIGDKVEGRFVGETSKFCNPYFDLSNYFGSDFKGFLPLSEESFSHMVISNHGVCSDVTREAARKYLKENGFNIDQL